MKKHKQYGRVFCKDGFNVSIQAGEGLYCTPRNNKGPYSHLELGMPSHPEELIIGYAEDPDRPTDTVYAYVPSTVVWELIAKHGYAVDGSELPPTCLF
tara:strand:+ start:483 stop:776 length:294 start_codon:yes stop_codon:yes gene_type:complete